MVEVVNTRALCQEKGRELGSECWKTVLEDNTRLKAYVESRWTWGVKAMEHNGICIRQREVHLGTNKKKTKKATTKVVVYFRGNAMKSVIHVNPATKRVITSQSGDVSGISMYYVGLGHAVAAGSICFK